MRAILAALSAGALLAAPPASAESPPWMAPDSAVTARLVDVGTWTFTSTQLGPDHLPECTETWTFNADGTGAIVSGQQRGTIKWFAKRDEPIGLFIYFAGVTTNEQPDCLGATISQSEFEQGDPGFQLLFHGTGEAALVCAEGAVNRRVEWAEYPMLQPEDCWGRIVPARKS